jgi:flagella basal body P-ring formation protein FlgA
MLTLTQKRLRISMLLTGVLSATGAMARAQTVSADDNTTDGQIVAPVTVPVVPVSEMGTELFVPRHRISAIGTLEIKSDVVVKGPEVKLREVCRWAQENSASFLPIADTVIDHLDSKRPKRITLDSLRNTMKDAGINLGLVHFAGNTSCLVSCADPETNTPPDERTGLNQWIDQSKKRANDPTPPATPTPTSNLPGPASAAETASIVGSDAPASDTFHTLRDLLLQDLSERLNIPVEKLQMTVDAKDTALLNLSEPTFHFGIEPRRVRDLGRVSWDVSILTGKSTQKVSIDGEARAWEEQLMVVKPVSDRQVLRDDDVKERRALMDHIDDDQLLTRGQVVGQEAARDLRPGMVMTARMVETVPLARTGQYVSITLTQGGIQIKTVARALEAGSFGQTIRVKADDSNEVFTVTLTGPQTGVMGPG